MSKHFYITITSIFVVLCTIIFFLHKTAALQLQAMIGGNVILYVVSILSYNHLHNTLMSGNSKKFIFQIMFLLVVKLFVYALMVVAIVLYLNKDVPSSLIYLLLIMYLIYTFTDNRFILALNRSIDKK
jgi:ACR3 family arsenite efflux pump ArsB